MDETRITQIPPGAVQEMPEDDVRTNEEAVEAMAILGEEHVEAVASMGAAEAREETEEDECRLEQLGNDSDDGERADQLEPVQETVDADPERDGQEDQPYENPGSGIPEDGVAEEPGEALDDEPPGEAESPAESPAEGKTQGAGETAEASGTANAADEAVKKLKDWKQKAGHPYCTLICDHLIRRCKEDAGFAQDVLTASRTWNNCFGYIKDKARKEASAGVACIEDRIVYEWAEDYIRTGEENEPKKASGTEAKKSSKSTKNAQKRNKSAGTATENAHTAAESAQSASENAQIQPKDPESKEPEAQEAGSEEKPAAKKRKSKEKPKAPKAEKPKKEKKPKDAGMDGQMDLFSLFG